MSVSAQAFRANFVQNCRALTPRPLLQEAAFIRYLHAVDGIVSQAGTNIASRVADELRTLIATPNWLPDECFEGSDECYKRHLLYADPSGRFTVLALVWQHGQTSPIHGHTAWCAMGVYAGKPSAATYRCDEPSAPVEVAVHHCRAGQVEGVEAGIEAPHRVFNDSNDVAITIHTYGRDLVDDPCSINILF